MASYSPISLPCQETLGTQLSRCQESACTQRPPFWGRPQLGQHGAGGLKPTAGPSECIPLSAELVGTGLAELGLWSGFSTNPVSPLQAQVDAMSSDDFDIVIEAMLEAPYKKEEVRLCRGTAG